MKNRMALFLCLIANISLAQSVVEQKLHANWKFRQENDSSWMAATVPGTVHTDLLANGKIGDPYFRTNEKQMQWIDKTGWTYQTSFRLAPELKNKQHLEIDFQGLDTYADVYLNDRLLFKADNFFVNWTADVSSLIDTGINKLTVVFHSPTQKGSELLNKFGYPLPSNNDQSETGGMGDKKVGVFLRKPGYHFGWDWGPRLVTSGIWRPVVLKGWNNARITDVFYEQKKITKNLAEVVAHVTIEADKELAYSLQINGEKKQLATHHGKISAGTHEILIPLSIPDPPLWWPHNLGAPRLYECNVSLLQGQQRLDSRQTHTGLRDIQITRKPDSTGSSFYVQVNGTPVFCKGANYIPQDMFIPRVSAGKYDSLIQAAIAANMNMLRVWGGGFYENDLFYELCDKAGILVWQDFMFACSMFPGDTAYLAKIKNEADYNIRRLRNHPSIALWCGNNEIDQAWSNYQEKAGWGWKQRYTPVQQAELWLTYQKIFAGILPASLKENNPTAFYWPSSPFNTTYVSAGDQTKNGDMHYWGVWHGEHDLEAFNDHIGRFMSEFGFQSFPELATVKKFALPGDWNIDGEVMMAHQRTEIGNQRIRSYLNKYYRVPSQFPHLLYMGQVLQAEGMKIGLEAHRRAMPFNMGSLYWQINDCWPVASWSGMDYYQNWKALHYFVKKAFQNVLISPYIKNNQLYVQAVSDSLSAFQAQLTIELKTFDGKTIFTKTLDTTISPNSSAQLYTQPVADVLQNADAKDVFLTTRLSGQGKIIAENILYFDRVKNINLPEAKVISKVDRSEGSTRVTLSSAVLAKNVFLKFEDTDGLFSDNYFDLLPGESKTISFSPAQAATKLGKLQIMTVRDTYSPDASKKLASQSPGDIAIPQVYFPNQEDSIAKGFKLAAATMVFNRSAIRDGLLSQPEVCLVAGFDYPTVWTRDGSLNTWNAAAALMPGTALNTLRSLITTASDGKTYISGEYWDCLLFTIGSWEYYLNTGDKVFLNEAFQASLHTAVLLEQNEWDRERQLFRGAPFFQDGISGYPAIYSNTGVYEGKDWVSNIKKWVQVNPQLRAHKGFGLPMFVLSTNCIYYKAFTILPMMAKELGATLKQDYNGKAALLKQSINKQFWIPEKNTYRYMIDPGGNSDRQESAGIALAILFDIADDAKSKFLFKNTYVAPAGIPCVYPSFERYTGPGKDQYARHSGTVWPQVQGLWALAAAKKGETSLFYHELRSLTHNAMRDQQFREIYHPVTGLPYGGMQEDNTGKVVLTESMHMQTWTASSFWAMIIKGAFGISLQDKAISFAPLPPNGSKRYALKNYRYHNAVLNVEVLGEGNHIKAFEVNGKQQQQPMLSSNSTGVLNVVISMEQ